MEDDIKLHQPAIPRIEEQPDANGLMSVFKALAREAEGFGNTVGQVCMPFIEADDEFEEGTWVPEFWFVVRKVLPDEPNRTG